MDEYEKIKGAIEEIVKAIKNISETIKRINEEIAEQFREIVFEEREKYKPCPCVPLPPPSYRSIKLWRKNKAIFRPYRRAQKGGENMRSEEAFYELF